MAPIFTRPAKDFKYFLSRSLVGCLSNALDKNVNPIEQRVSDTNAEKIDLSCHRCLINTGVEKMNNIKYRLEL
jgi:hypothetical protein